MSDIFAKIQGFYQQIEKDLEKTANKTLYINPSTQPDTNPATAPGLPTASYAAPPSTGDFKKMVASMETSGDTSGDYLQLKGNNETLKTLKNLGLNKNIQMKDLDNPSVYAQAADIYQNKYLPSYGLTNAKDQALWSTMPGYYSKTGGDITKLPTDKFRNFNGQVLNYQQIMQRRSSLLNNSSTT
jgi:hypothetical protein